MKKRILITIVLNILLITNIIISFKLILKEQKIVRVNDKNKEIIYEGLEGKIEDLESIKMVGIGMGFQSEVLEVYYSINDSERLIISEGSDYGEIESYLRDKDNGIYLDRIAIIIGGVGSIIIIAAIIICRKNLKK